MTGNGESADDLCLKVLPSLRCVPGAAAVVLLAALAWRLFSYVPPEPAGYDEAALCRYAEALGERGAEGVRDLLRRWPDDAFLRQAPLPFRLSVLIPGVWACQLQGGYTARNLAAASLVCGVGMCGVAFLLARRWVGPVRGLFAAALVVFSPLATGLSTRALPDACHALAVAASLLFYDRFWRDGRRVRDLWLFGAALSAAVLAKETTLLLYPAYALAGFCYARRGDGRDGLRIAIPFAAAPLAYLAAAAWLSGGLGPCLQVCRGYCAMQRKIPYALQYQAGPWFRYVVDFALVSPLPLLLAAVGMAAADPQAAWGGGTRAAATVFSLAAFAAMSAVPVLNVRFVLFLDPLLRVFAAQGAAALFGRVRGSPRARCAAAGLLLLVLVSADVAQRHRLYVTGRVYDPVTAELLRANGFVRDAPADRADRPPSSDSGARRQAGSR